MINELFVPLHKMLCDMPGIKNIEVGEQITFQYNSISWIILYSDSEKVSYPFKLMKNGVLILGFVRPESLKEFFKK